MTPNEKYQSSESNLDAVSKALLDPRPEILEYCEEQLQEVIDTLESAEAASITSGAESRAALIRLRQKARLLGMQTQNAIHLCQGWTQLGLSQGYTEQGKLVLPLTEPQTSYEV